MTAPDRLLEVARRQIGVVEKPPHSNHTAYNAWYGMPRQPWCAMFVSWCLDQVGIKGFKHAYTPAQADLFRKAGRWTTDPAPGDIAFFDFPDSKKRIQHVGIVESVPDGKTVVCIEGNTSAGAKGSQDNGGGVHRRTRPRSIIVGYGRPPWTGKPANLPKPAATPPPPKSFFGKDDKGADVVIWQRQLNDTQQAGLSVDGEFGPRTLEATIAFQKRSGIEAHGRVDRTTIDAMEALYRRVAPPPPVDDLAPRHAVAVRYGTGSAADERIARALAAFLDAHVANHEDLGTVGVVHLVGGTAVRGFNRELAAEVVEHTGSNRQKTWEGVSALIAERIAKV
jgi:hypothetical protein